MRHGMAVLDVLDIHVRGREQSRLSARIVLAVNIPFEESMEVTLLARRRMKYSHSVY